MCKLFYLDQWIWGLDKHCETALLIFFVWVSSAASISKGAVDASNSINIILDTSKVLIHLFLSCVLYFLLFCIVFLRLILSIVRCSHSVVVCLSGFTMFQCILSSVVCLCTVVHDVCNVYAYVVLWSCYFFSGQIYWKCRGRNRNSAF